MGYFFHHKKAASFLKIDDYYQAYKKFYPPKKWETLEKFEMFLKKKSFGFGRKCFASDTNTKNVPWFWFPIPKPGLGHTLPPASKQHQQ